MVCPLGQLNDSDIFQIPQRNLLLDFLCIFNGLVKIVNLSALCAYECLIFQNWEDVNDFVIVDLSFRMIIIAIFIYQKDFSCIKPYVDWLMIQEKLFNLNRP
jgi:hypothetical protein